MSEPASGGLGARLARQLPDCTDSAEAARCFLREISGGVRARGWIAWRDDDGAVSWVPEGEGEPFPARLARGEGSLLGELLRSGEQAVLPDPEEAADSPERRYLMRSGGAWALLPIVAGGKTHGCLVLRASRPAALDDETLDPVRGALPLLALSMRAGRLQRALEARVRERTEEIYVLYDISRALGFVLTPDDLHRLIGSSLRRAINFDMCALLLLLEERREMSIHSGGDADDAATRKLSRLVTAHAAELSGGRQGPIPVKVLPLPDRTDPARGAGAIRSVAHVPIYIRGDLAGILSVASRAEDAFGEVAMRLLYTVANQTSLTLDRLRTAREAEAIRIHSMLESMADGVLLLDGDLKIVMSNPAAQSYLEILRGRRSGRAVARLGEVPLRPVLDRLGAPGAGSRTFEVPVEEFGRVFSVTCSPVKGLEDPPQGMVVVLSDVTEARGLQSQLAQSEKLSALGEMISGVAHELNNPLATVTACAQLLQGQGVDEAIRRKLHVIDAEATRCRKIVQNLLRFARRHEPERSLVDINGTLDSVLQLLGRQLELDGVSVSLDLAPDLVPVLGDPHLLQQVFLNIIYNANQAMKNPDGPRTLAVKTARGDGMSRVEIADSGPGIPPEVLKRIFDPFFSTKRVGQGTGLGLSLAYGTVKDHGGTITARSRPGAGATFIVDLPVAAEEALAAAKAAAAPQPETTVRLAARDSGAAPTVPADSPARRILVVEDETTLADVVAEVLQAHGHVVDTVGDGTAAWSRISNVTYDVIISDLKMPNMNGREFYRYVARERPDLARRIIFSTGDTASPDTQAFFREVGNPFLTKPFNIQDLLKAVEAVLAGG